MKTAGRAALTRGMAACYRALLRLYPRQFQALFADELYGVFLQSLREAEQQGREALWACFLRELLDFLPNILREYITNPRFQNMIERLLTHHEYSRWRQAGALGFAVSFGLLELVSQAVAPQGSSIAMSTFPISAVQISILSRPEGGMGITPFHGLGMLLLAASGLVAGVLLNRAEQPAANGQPARRLRLPVVAALSMAGAYILLYAVELTLWRGQAAVPRSLAQFFYAVLNLLSPFLYGIFASIFLGLGARVLPGKGRLWKALYRHGAAGMGGVLFGGLAGLLWLAVAGLVQWSVRAIERLVFQLPDYPQNTFLDRSPVFGVLFMVMFSAVLGWYFGAWVGNELGRGRESRAPVSPYGRQKPFDYGLMVLAVLAIVALVSLTLVAVNGTGR